VQKVAHREVGTQVHSPALSLTIRDISFYTQQLLKPVIGSTPTVRNVLYYLHGQPTVDVEITVWLSLRCVEPSTELSFPPSKCLSTRVTFEEFPFAIAPAIAHRPCNARESTWNRIFDIQNDASKVQVRRTRFRWLFRHLPRSNSQFNCSDPLLPAGRCLYPSLQSATPSRTQPPIRPYHSIR
jgi:hypothetical protein